MTYKTDVNFEETNLYGCGPDHLDDVYTIAEFHRCCENGAFVDSDGYGHPVKGKKSDGTIFVSPSRLDEIPADATHIVWFNR